MNSIARKTVLANGITVIVAHNPAADIMAARLFLQAGTRHQPANKAGVTHLLAAVLTKGTPSLSSMDIAEKVESVGASLGADVAADYFLTSLKTVSPDFAQMLHLTAELLRSPAFPEAEVDLERRLTLQAIRSQQEQPFGVAFDTLRRSMYGQHPYAVSSLGEPEVVKTLTRDDLVNFHRTYFRPDRLVISISGCIPPEKTLALVEDAFGDWENPVDRAPESVLGEIVTRPQAIADPQDTQQAIVMLGYLAPAVASQKQSLSQRQDYATLKLLNTYLGNGLSSRLFVEMREKRGLAYDVSAFYSTRLDPSQFVVYMGTAPQNTRVAVEGLKAEVDRLREGVLTPEELADAKTKLLGQYALGKQTNAQIAHICGWYEILELGLEFDDEFVEAISSVTLSDAKMVADRYLSEPHISLVGPEAELKHLGDLLPNVKFLDSELLPS